MKTPKYELEQQRLQSIGQTPPVAARGMAMPGPMKVEGLQTTLDPMLNWNLSRDSDGDMDRD